MFPQFDPSKMDPKVLMELSRLIQTLPPDMINRMQTIMHNAMAGHDVKNDMEAFERQLPAGFREKLMSLMAGQMGAFNGFSPTPAPSTSSSGGTIEIQPISAGQGAHEGSSNMDVRDARLTILKAVADGRMSPEEAEHLLFG